VLPARAGGASILYWEPITDTPRIPFQTFLKIVAVEDAEDPQVRELLDVLVGET